MRPRRVHAEQDSAAIFDEAVRQHALAVLTVQDAQGWQSFKSRFLERDPNQRFFVLDFQPAADTCLPELLCGQYVGVSFRHHNRKMLFATLVEAKGHFILEDRVTVPAVRYRWPASITELQRRSYYRTPVPENLNLLATLWPGGLDARAAAQNSTLQIVSGSLVDLSCGGALVRPHNAAPPPWKDGDTLGAEIQIADGKPAVLVNGYYRGARQDSLGQLNAAVQFIGLELTVDGRLVLQRLARCVQRFHRLSVAAGTASWNRRSRP